MRGGGRAGAGGRGPNMRAGGRITQTPSIPQENCGPLFIPIILEKLPDDMKLGLRRKLGTDKRKIDEFLEILKEEIFAKLFK